MPLVSPEMTAVVRHLSGPRRGRAQQVKDPILEITVGGNAQWRIHPPVAAKPTDPAAWLRRAGPTYELEVAAGGGIRVNGECFTGSRLLGSGDLIELGDGGPLLRFRLYSPGAIPAKTLAEVFFDSLDGARLGSRSRVGRIGSFLARFFHDLATQTAAGFRAWVVILVAALVMSVAQNI